MAPLALLSVALAASGSPSAAADPPAFKARILAQPAIAHPTDPFVHIFFFGGSGNNRYGLRTDGAMSEDDWRDVLQHVGYLAPYAAFQPVWKMGWTQNGADGAVRAGQSLRRPTGGCVMGCPQKPEEIACVQAAYADKLGLGMTHYFDDDEQDSDTPGGGGSFRLRMNHSLVGALAAGGSSDFDTGLGGRLENFRLTFGFYEQFFVFGGSAVLFGCRTGGYGPTGLGWYVRVENGGGYAQTNVIKLFTDGTECATSKPFDHDRGWLWQTITITVGPGPTPDKVTVTIDLAGVGSTTTAISRPTVTDAGLGLGAGNGAMKERQTDYDDLELAALKGTQATVIAHYDFEADAAGPAAEGQAVTGVSDLSGRHHDLRPEASAGMFSYFPTSGLSAAIAGPVKQRLLDDLLSARRQAAVAPPVMLSNWALSDRPGRFAAWRKLGFTHASTDYYVGSETPPGMPNLNDGFFRTYRAQWAWMDGSPWQAVWWGNLDVKQVPTAAQQRTASTLAVLDGNRWFLVFVQMSNGTFCPSTETNVTTMAAFNADCLYALAQTASWFQSTRATLEDSMFLDTSARAALGIPPDLVPFCRARRSEKTKELWFGGYVPAAGGRRSATLKLPAASGTMANLATGETVPVAGGTCTLALTEDAQPWHFTPG